MRPDKLDRIGAWLLARLKALTAFVGAVATFGTTLDWGVTLPPWVTAAAAVATFVGVYAVPNVDYRPVEYRPRRELVEDENVVTHGDQ